MRRSTPISRGTPAIPRSAVDRVGRQADIVHFPAITVAAVVQPSVIAGLAARPEFRGRGFLARFMYAVPRSWVGYRRVSPPTVSDEILETYAAKIATLLALKPSSGEGMEEQAVGPPTVL